MKAGRKLIRLACLVCAATMLLGAGGAADTDVAVLARSRPSPETAIAKRVLAQELGRTIADSDIAAAGLEISMDVSPELLIFPLGEVACAPAGCRPRLLTMSQDGYVDLLAGVSLPDDVTPDQFFVRPSYHGQYYDLVVGGRTLVHHGSAYVDAATIEPTRLEETAFLEACGRSDMIGRQLGGHGQDTATTAPEFCECIAAGFEDRQLPQESLDLYKRYVANEVTDEELYGIDTSVNDVSDIGFEIQESCAGVKGWKTPITPATDDYPAGYEALNFDGLMDACTAQPWVTGNRQLAKPQRAVAFCGCITREVLKTGYGQSAFDRLASFYRDEISEADFLPDLPSLLELHDTTSERCIDSMRWTTP